MHGSCKLRVSRGLRWGGGGGCLIFLPCLTTTHAPPPRGGGMAFGATDIAEANASASFFSVSHHACPPPRGGWHVVLRRVQRQVRVPHFFRVSPPRMPPRGVGDVVASFQAVAAMGSVASHAAHGSHGLLGGLRVSRLQAGLSFFLAPHLPSKRWQPWGSHTQLGRLRF